MKVRIHFEWPDGTEDSFLLTGDSVEEIRSKAEEEISKRNGKNPWSQEVS